MADWKWLPRWFLNPSPADGGPALLRRLPPTHHHTHHPPPHPTPDRNLLLEPLENIQPIVESARAKEPPAKAAEGPTQLVAVWIHHPAERDVSQIW